MAVYLSPIGLSAAQVSNRVSLLAIYKERLCRRVCESATNQPEAFVTYKTGTPIFNGTTVFVPVIATVTIVTPGSGCEAKTQVIVEKTPVTGANMIFLAGLPLFCKFSGQNQVSVSAISKKSPPESGAEWHP